MTPYNHVSVIVAVCAAGLSQIYCIWSTTWAPGLDCSVLCAQAIAPVVYHELIIGQVLPLCDGARQGLGGLSGLLVCGAGLSASRRCTAAAECSLHVCRKIIHVCKQ